MKAPREDPSLMSLRTTSDVLQKQRDALMEAEQSSDDEQAIAKGGVARPFPWRLHDMLDAAEDENLDEMVKWLPHGRAFLVLRPKEFVDVIMTRYFSQTKFASFQRQLNLYGFKRIAHGRDKGAYFHFCFVRGHRTLVKGMVRRKIKGTKVRRALIASEEPDFYASEWNSRNFKTTIPLDNDDDDSSSRATTPPPTAKYENLPKNSSPTTVLPEPQLTTSRSYGQSTPRTWDSIDEMTVQDGDIVFFEGSPFHYLERIDEASLLDTGSSSNMCAV